MERPQGDFRMPPPARTTLRVVLAAAQQWEADKAAAAWRQEVDARIQGLGHAIYCMRQALPAQTWGAGRGEELQGQEETYFMEQKQERSTVWARGWVGGGVNNEDEDNEYDKENNMVVLKERCLC